jgi:hypothetical protein
MSSRLPLPYFPFFVPIVLFWALSLLKNLGAILFFFYPIASMTIISSLEHTSRSLKIWRLEALRLRLLK